MQGLNFVVGPANVSANTGTGHGNPAGTSIALLAGTAVATHTAGPGPVTWEWAKSSGNGVLALPSNGASMNFQHTDTIPSRTLSPKVRTGAFLVRAWNPYQVTNWKNVGATWTWQHTLGPP